MSGRKEWFEEYACGCVSEPVPFRRDLLGYCAKHGDSRRNVFTQRDDFVTRVQRVAPKDADRAR